jgi:hypothetical protein
VDKKTPKLLDRKYVKQGIALSLALLVSVVYYRADSGGSLVSTAYTAGGAATVFLLTFLFAYFVMAKIISKFNGFGRKSKIALSIAAVMCLLSMIDIIHCNNWKEAYNRNGFFALVAQQCPTPTGGAQAKTTNDSQAYTCDSDWGKGGLKQSLEGGTNQVLNIKVVDFIKLSEIDYDEQSRELSCVGRVILNAGIISVFYKFSPLPSDSSKYMTQTIELDRNFDASQASKTEAIGAVGDYFYNTGNIDEATYWYKKAAKMSEEALKNMSAEEKRQAIDAINGTAPSPEKENPFDTPENRTIMNQKAQ